MKIRSWSFSPPYRRTGVSCTVAKCLRPRGRAKPNQPLNEHQAYDLRDSRAGLVAWSICQRTANKDDMSESQPVSHPLRLYNHRNLPAMYPTNRNKLVCLTIRSSVQRARGILFEHPARSTVGALCGKQTQDVRLLEENKLLLIQCSQECSTIRTSGTIRKPHFWGPTCGEFQLDLFDVPPLATIPNAMTVSVYRLEDPQLERGLALDFLSRSDFIHSG